MRRKTRNKISLIVKQETEVNASKHEEKKKRD